MEDQGLAARIARLEDIEAIRVLKAAYCDAVDDDHNGARVAALFVEDGVWHSTGHAPCVGHAAIAKFMDDLAASGRILRSAHLVTNPVIEVEGDEARGTWRLQMLYTGPPGDGGQPQHYRILGRYDERYVRRDGRWWFASLVADVEERGQL